MAKTTYERKHLISGLMVPEGHDYHVRECGGTQAGMALENSQKLAYDPQA